MVGLFLACMTFTAVNPPGASPPTAGAPGREGYLDAQARAGAGAAGQLKLALWCEAHGLKGERLRHLAAAVLRDPNHAAARALLGLIDDGGKWRDAPAVAARVRADEALSRALAAYNARRDRTPNTADGQWKLALWCEENGLKAEATAHLTAVVRLDPRREAAWKKLGYTRQHDGRWMTPEQVAAEKAAREAQARADAVWKPRLEQWKSALGRPAERDAAARALDGVSDPLAVPAIWRTFVAGKKPDPARAVVLLGRTDGPLASQALAVLAVRGDSAEVRRAARETLRRRDPREFLDGLIALFRDPKILRKPMPTAVAIKPVGADYIGSPGFVWYREGNTVYEHGYTVDESLGMGSTGFPVMTPVYAPPGANPNVAGVQNLAARLSAQPGPSTPARAAVAGALQNAATNLASQPVGFAAGPGIQDYMNRVGLQNMRIQATAASLQAEAEAANAQAIQTAAAIADWNRETDDTLHAITASDPGHDAEAWRAWWADQQGYVYERRPPEPVVEETPIEPLSVVSTGWTHLSCFAAGTPVKTITGYTPIEAVKVGDLVLAQDVDTGRLSFQPVLAAHHNKPSATLKLSFDGGSNVVATGIHRFWKAGQGWVMARDLKPGDPVRTAGGLVKVAATTDGPVQPVFNLEVARGASFFVGEPGVLVHDNSLVSPVATPFDAPTEPASGAAPRP